MTIRCVFNSPNGLNNAWLKMSIFTEKSCFLTKLIFTSVTMWTSRIVVFGGIRESARRHGEADALTTSDCLVWFLSGGIIGPFFFENEQGAAVTVNGERYRALLNEFLLWRGGYRRHLVSIGRRTLPHSQRYRSFAHCLRKSHNQPKCWCQLAALHLRFDSAGLFFMGNHQGWMLH